MPDNFKKIRWWVNPYLEKVKKIHPIWWVEASLIYWGLGKWKSIGNFYIHCTVYNVHQAPSQWLNSAQDDCPVSVSRRGPDQLCVPRTCWRRRGRPWSYYRSKGEPCSCLCQCRQATLTRKAPSTDCPDDRRQPPKDIDSRNPWTGSWMLVDPWHLPVTIKSFQPSWWSPAQSLQQLQELSKCPVHRGFPRK